MRFGRLFLFEEIHELGRAMVEIGGALGELMPPGGAHIWIVGPFRKFRGV